MAPSHLDFCKRGLDPLGAAAGTGRDQDVPRRGVGATVASRRGRAPGGGRAGCPRPPEPRPPAGQLVGASGGRHGLGLGDPFALKPAARPCSARAASAIAKPPPTELGARSGHPPSCKMTGTMRIPDRTMGGGAWEGENQKCRRGGEALPQTPTQGREPSRICRTAPPPQQLPVGASAPSRATLAREGPALSFCSRFCLERLLKQQRAHQGLTCLPKPLPPESAGPSFY